MTSPQKRRNAETLEKYLATSKHEQARKVFKEFFVLARVCSWLKNSLHLRVSTFLVCVVFLFAGNSFAQIRKQTESKVPAKKTKVAPKNVVSNLPKVTQIDAEALKNLLKPNGKPLLINFWATWCEPCREEFPDLVKIGADYKDKIDLITISLDELSEINGDVPKFLAEMKAEMPSYLLKTTSEETAIAIVSKDWQGGLPFTILFNEKGESVYLKQGKFDTAFLRAEIEKTLVAQNPVTNLQILELPKRDFFSDLTYEKGKADAESDVARGKLLIKRYGLTPSASSESFRELKEKYGVEFFDFGCLVSDGLIEYVKGYNEVSSAEIKRKFGDKVLAMVTGE